MPGNIGTSLYCFHRKVITRSGPTINVICVGTRSSLPKRGYRVAIDNVRGRVSKPVSTRKIKNSDRAAKVGRPLFTTPSGFCVVLRSGEFRGPIIHDMVPSNYNYWTNTAIRNTQHRSTKTASWSSRSMMMMIFLSVWPLNSPISRVAIDAVEDVTRLAT